MFFLSVSGLLLLFLNQWITFLMFFRDIFVKIPNCFLNSKYKLEKNKAFVNWDEKASVIFTL